MSSIPPPPPVQPVQLGADAPKDWLVTLLLCLFLGGLGVHRFYTGHIGIGIAQLLTLGGCGIWAIIDLIMIITDKFTDAQGRPLQKK
ncbi:MAG TPA: TM2 domain-containing protein [Thermoanaerobaculaceae bacterium]|nr:TM2 domain-containing protein [Thermoanaerobaculaceae bacterium]